MKFDNILIDALKTELTSGTLVPFLVGEPGIGKSSLVEDLAKSMGTKCFTLACNQLADKADLTGQRLVPTGTKDAKGNDRYMQVFFPHQVISDAIEYAEANPQETPILFLDELNRTTPDITSACLSLPTLRRIGSSDLPDNLKIIAAGNDRGNVTSLDTASISRFVPYRVEPDVNTFLNLDPNLNKYVRKTLENYPSTLFGKPLPIALTSQDDDTDDDDTVLAQIDDILGEDESMEQFTTPRTITGVSNWLNAISDSKLFSWLSTTTMVNGEPVSILQEMVEAHVGRTEFAMALMKEIRTSVQTAMANPAPNAVTITKPNSFDNMKACQTLDELNQLIDSMSDQEKSSNLLYSLYDRGNNEVIVRALAHALPQLEPTDIILLSKASTNGMLDDNNLEACYATNTPVSISMQNVLSL